PVVQVRRGGVADHDPDVLVALDVLVHRGDAGAPARGEDVLGVGVTPRPQADLSAPGHPNPVHQYRVDLGTDGVVGQWIPPIHTLGDLGHQPYRLVQGVRIAQHTVQARHRLGRHGVALVYDARGPRIGGPGLRLLLVRHRHHPQREYLVDLRAVIQGGVA